MNRLITAPLLAMLGLLGLLGACARDDRTPRQLLDDGVTAWRAGSVVEAERLLRAATERAADAGTDKHTMRMYHGYLFALLATQGRLADAEKAYAAGVETTTDFMINPVAGHNLGVLRLRAGDGAGAATLLRATRNSLHSSSGSGDERLLEIMVLMHLDLATSAAAARESGIDGEVLQVLEDLLRYQQSAHPYLHPALLRELDTYAERLATAGFTATAAAVRERTLTQRARGADPGVPAGSCLTLDLESPAGCILGLDPEP